MGKDSDTSFDSFWDEWMIKHDMIEITRAEYIEEILKDIDEWKIKCEDRKKSDETYCEKRLEEYKKTPNP